jgi:hypothetical protein
MLEPFLYLSVTCACLVRHFRATSERPNSGGETNFRDNLKDRTGYFDRVIIGVLAYKSNAFISPEKEIAMTSLLLDVPSASPDERLQYLQ